MAPLDIAPLITPGEPTVPTIATLRAKYVRLLAEAAALSQGLRDDLSADDCILVARGLDATLAGLAQIAAVRSHVRTSSVPPAPREV